MRDPSAPPHDLVLHHRDMRGRPSEGDGAEAQEQQREFAQTRAAIVGRDRRFDFHRRFDHRELASSVRDGRQHQDLPAHLRLMHEALEAEHALAMKGKNPRSFLERRKFLIHQDAEIGTDQREIVLVVGL